MFKVLKYLITDVMKFSSRVGIIPASGLKIDNILVKLVGLGLGQFPRLISLGKSLVARDDVTDVNNNVSQPITS
jgi:hypothetical protein